MPLFVKSYARGRKCLHHAPRYDADMLLSISEVFSSPSSIHTSVHIRDKDQKDVRFYVSSTDPRKGK